MKQFCCDAYLNWLRQGGGSIEALQDEAAVGVVLDDVPMHGGFCLHRFFLPQALHTLSFVLAVMRELLQSGEHVKMKRRRWASEADLVLALVVCAIRHELALLLLQQPLGLLADGRLERQLRWQRRRLARLEHAASQLCVELAASNQRSVDLGRAKIVVRLSRRSNSTSKRTRYLFRLGVDPRREGDLLVLFGLFDGCTRLLPLLLAFLVRDNVV
jgi:hypothetical protein